MIWGYILPSCIFIFLILSGIRFLKKSESSFLFFFLLPALMNFAFDGLLFVFFKIDLLEPKRIIFYLPFFSLALSYLILSGSLKKRIYATTIILFIYAYFLCYSMIFENTMSPYYEVKHFLKGKSFVKVDKDINPIILYLYFPDSIKTIYCDDPKQNESFGIATGIDVKNSKELTPERFHEVSSIVILKDEYMDTYFPKEAGFLEKYPYLNQYNRACRGYNLVFRRFSDTKLDFDPKGYKRNLEFSTGIKIFNPDVGFRIESRDNSYDVDNYYKNGTYIFDPIDFAITAFGYFKYYRFIPKVNGFSWFQTIPLFRSYQGKYYFKPLRAKFVFDPIIKAFIILLFIQMIIFLLFDFLFEKDET